MKCCNLYTYSTYSEFTLAFLKKKNLKVIIHIFFKIGFFRLFCNGGSNTSFVLFCRVLSPFFDLSLGCESYLNGTWKNTFLFPSKKKCYISSFVSLNDFEIKITKQNKSIRHLFFLNALRDLS